MEDVLKKVSCQTVLIKNGIYIQKDEKKTERYLEMILMKQY